MGQLECVGTRLLNFEVRRLGEKVRAFTAEADPTDPEQLRRLLSVHRVAICSLPSSL